MINLQQLISVSRSTSNLINPIYPCTLSNPTERLQVFGIDMQRTWWVVKLHLYDEWISAFQLHRLWPRTMQFASKLFRFAANIAKFMLHSVMQTHLLCFTYAIEQHFQ